MAGPTIPRRRFVALGGALLAGGLPGRVGAAPAGQATPLGQATPGVTTPELVVFSNSSPHVSVIDLANRRVARTADVPDFTSWTWNDDNNHADGAMLWLGLRNPDTDDVEVITLNLDSLSVSHRVAIGTDQLTLYIGKATADGHVLVSKMGSGQVVAFDAGTVTALATWDVPTNGDVVCDADISTDAQGREWFVYPTRNGETVVALDPTTGAMQKEVATPAGTVPLMLTTGRDGRIWVQESGTNTNAVYDPDLNLLHRFATGNGPIGGTFSPDGRLAYISHSGDTVVTAIDTRTYQEVARIEAGTNPQLVAAHPNGRELYAILTREAAVAVIDTTTWQVAPRIPLGTNPSGIFLRARSGGIGPQ